MEYTVREYTEMHFVYGFCDGNARAAQRATPARAKLGHVRYLDDEFLVPQ
jgi:hypothetical protein